MGAGTGAGEEARDKDTAEEAAAAPPRKCTAQGSARAFAGLSKLLKEFETTELNPERLSLTERHVHAVWHAYR